MVKLERLEIRLDNPTNIFYAGDVIDGAVLASVQQAFKVETIEIKLHGEAHTSWVNKTSDKIYESTDQYVNESFLTPYLHQVSDGELMPTGVHTVPFTFRLPPNLPSSYSGDFGYVRYKVCVVVTLSQDNVCMMPSLTSAREIVCEKVLTVLSVIDVKHVAKFPENGMTSEASFEVVGLCPCWPSGYIEASLTVPKCAAVVGRWVAVEATLCDKSSSSGRGRRSPAATASVQLVQRAYFQSKSRYESVCDAKTLDRLIELVPLMSSTSSENDDSAPKTTRRVVRLPVPADLTPTTVGADLLINVTYKVRLDLDLGCRGEISVPLFLATADSGASVYGDGDDDDVVVEPAVDR